MTYRAGNLERVSRRKAMQIGGAGFLGLTMPRWLRASEHSRGIPVRAKSVIFLYQFGGPSHIDMFDLKPSAPEGIRGPHRGIDTSVPGVKICEQLPAVSRVMDKLTLVRSVHHTMKNHNPASYYALTGHAPPVDDIRLRDSLDLFPAYGSAVDRLAPGDAQLPTFVAYPYVIRDGEITPGQHASFLGKKHDPLLVTEDPAAPGFRLPELSLPAGITPDRLATRQAVRALVERQAGLGEISALARGIDDYYRRAAAMLSSPRVRDAFDLTQEPDDVRERYGRQTYGQSCLLARRLVEAGVRFVNVYFSESIGGQSDKKGGWDTHGFNNTRMFPIIQKLHLPLTDQTLPTLLIDLDERGLLDETLVVWMGEFGRTPRINQNASRDHWPHCYTVLLAGGGIKRGYVHGASDRDGAYPARDPVRLEDLAATMFYLLGIDPHTEVQDASGRPLPIAAGQVVHDLIA
jgi:hypothetical protein